MASSSRILSCQTLTDGLDHLTEEARKLQEEELEVEREIQASSKEYIYIYRIDTHTYREKHFLLR